MPREHSSIRNSIRPPLRFAALLAFMAMAVARPATALVVNPHFSGSHTIDRFTLLLDYEANVGFEYEPERQQIYIDVAHGMVDDGGLISGVTPGEWEFDMNVWAPLMCNYDITEGGVVTYGNPAPGVFAVTWDRIALRDAPAVRNTFQVVFIGDAGYHTNTGLAIQPGSVIFAYGAPSDPSGTVHFATGVDMAIGILRNHGLSTLAGLNVGDSTGFLYPEDEAALQNSGDPFLFQPAGNGFQAPIAFSSVSELGGTSAVGTPSVTRLSLAVSPNPIRTGTTIRYSLAREGRIRLAIYDLGGRLVSAIADRFESAGAHQAVWDARTGAGARLAPGVYLVRLTSDYGEAKREVVVVR